MLSIRTVEIELWARLGREEAEGIEPGLKVSPASEKIENLLSFKSGSLDRHYF